MSNGKRNIVTNTTESVASKIAFVLGGSDEILHSEAQGQVELVMSDVLPTDLGGSKILFEALGFTFGEVVKNDPIFQYVKLPDGWTKLPTDHSMWSKIVDQDNNDRVAIFYKAAFYDRNAFAFLKNRYETEKIVGKTKWVVKDQKTKNIVFHPSDEDGFKACNEWIKENCKGNIVEQWAL